MNDNPLNIGDPHKFGAGWNVSALAEITIFIKDGTHGTHERVEQGFPLLSAKDISKTGKVELNNNPSLISKSDFELIHSKYEIEMGDILLTVVGTLGRCAICVTQDKFSIQRSVAVIRLNQLAVERRYLYYFFSGSWFQSQLQIRSNSTAQAGVYLGELAQIEVAYPPLPQQQKIAKILTTVDNLIEQTQALIDKYTAIKQGMMADLFTRGIDLSGTPETNPNHGQLRPSFEEAPELYKETELGWVPREWEVFPLHDISEKIQDGTHFSPTIGGGEYLYLTSKNIRFGFLTLDNIETIDRAQHESIYKRCDVRKGDLLLTKDGANTGNAAINDIDEPFSMLSSVAFIRSNNRSTEQFILHYLLSDIAQNRIKDAMSGNAITRLTLKKINEFVIPCPLKSEQIEIASRLNALSAAMEKEKNLMLKLRNQKKGLMQDLLTGKVQVTA